ncbi:MAG: DUF192 domain-containing protein [Alphaproteobacteria bacterium]
MRIAIPMLLLGFLFAIPAFAQEVEPFERSSLAIESAKGRHAFSVEVARSVRQQAQGLMYRRDMAADHGMLFDYNPPRRVAMWMKNTFIPLDMLFIGADGRIVSIAQRTLPQSLDLIDFAGPVRGVLELNAGTVARLGIATGDRVVHPIFAGN